jgi:sugar lactone lactonase YvrE
VTLAVDFFISYTRADSAWAEWIAHTLEDAGYSTKIQAWDFRPGSDFVYEMQQATQQADRTIAVLSPKYLGSQFGELEWREALARDPNGELGSLLPVRVADVIPPGLLRTRIYIDLVGLDEPAAARALLAGVNRSRAKPSGRRPFPGSQLPHDGASFPGRASTIRATPSRNPQAVVDDPKLGDQARSMSGAGRLRPAAEAGQLREKESEEERQGGAHRQAASEATTKREDGQQIRAGENPVDGLWVRKPGGGETKPSIPTDHFPKPSQPPPVTPVRAARHRQANVASYLRERRTEEAARPKQTGSSQNLVIGVSVFVTISVMIIVAFALGARRVDALKNPGGLALDAHGNLYVADSGSHRIRKVTPDRKIIDVAGASTGRVGSSGDGGAATKARLNSPAGVAVDRKGNLYIADSSNHRVRRVSTTGKITTLVGTGREGFSGDGGAATKATLSYPADVAVDAKSNLYIADSGNYRVRKVDGDGRITTVPATKREQPSGVVVDAKGNLYIASSNRIRRVGTDGKITTVAGTGSAGFSGENGPATRARLNSPTDVAVDAKGNLYIADSYNHRVRRVSTTGKITTVAGSGTPGTSGDGGKATKAQLGDLRGIAVDAKGNLYITEHYVTGYSSGGPLKTTNQLRLVATDGTITTIVR